MLIIDYLMEFEGKKNNKLRSSMRWPFKYSCACKMSAISVKQYHTSQACHSAMAATLIWVREYLY